MATRLNHYALTLTGLVQRLSTALSITEDSAMRGLWLSAGSANSGVIYIGGSSTLTSSNYGVRLEIPASAIPGAPFNPCEVERGFVRLGDIYVLGANTDKLYILAVAAGPIYGPNA